MIKKLLAPIFLSLALAGTAQAAPPTTAQLERLLTAMDAEKVVNQMIPAMMQQSTAMVEQELVRANASEADVARFQRMKVEQEASLRDMLSWKNIKPIYIRVYADTMTAEEVEAMTGFYESPEGRSVLQKMPQVLQRTMVEMQPLAQSAMKQMMRNIEASKEEGAKADDK